MSQQTAGLRSSVRASSCQTTFTADRQDGRQAAIIRILPPARHVLCSPPSSLSPPPPPPSTPLHPSELQEREHHLRQVSLHSHTISSNTFQNKTIYTDYACISKKAWKAHIFTPMGSKIRRHWLFAALHIDGNTSRVKPLQKAWSIRLS